MEHVPDITRQRRHHLLFLVLRILLELIQANRTLIVVPEYSRVESLLDETVPQLREALLLFDAFTGHLAVHVDEDGDE